MILSDDAYLQFQGHILTWFRYIDDIFVVWDGPHDLLDEFFEQLKSNYFNLKFTMQADSLKLSFLDVENRIDPSGRLLTDLYWKPTAGNTRLRFNSAHPVPL